MTKPSIFKSDAFEAVHDAISGMRRAGTIDKTTLSQFDEACLVTPDEYVPDDITKLRGPI